MQLIGADVVNTKNYSNFYCKVTKTATGVSYVGSSADCGSIDISATPTTAYTYTTFAGNNIPYGSVAKCPSNSPQSNYYQSQSYVDATSTEYAYHTCTNFRSSLDTATALSAPTKGSTITYKAGFTIFASTGAIASS
jgi:hypothetical protein